MRFALYTLQAQLCFKQFLPLWNVWYWTTHFVKRNIYLSVCLCIHRHWHLVTISCYLLDRHFRIVTYLENLRSVIWEYPDTCHSVGMFLDPYIIVACLIILCKHTTSFNLTIYLSDRITLSSSFHKSMRTWGVTQKLKLWPVRSIAVIKQNNSRV